MLWQWEVDMVKYERTFLIQYVICEGYIISKSAALPRKSINNRNLRMI